MKINSDLERILRAQQQPQTATQKSADSSAAFDNVLQEALQKPDAAGISKEFSAPSIDSRQFPIHGIDAANDSANVEKTAQSVNAYSVHTLMADIENSLSGLDSYTKNLQNSHGADLKQAWQNLSAFNQSVGSLRQNYASLSQQDSSLDAMINDLEIMAVTETYKFNRGDYNL